MTIVVHTATQHILDATINDLPQSLLLSGSRGVGLLTIARWLASTQRISEICPQDSKQHTNTQNGTISVEVVRRLYAQTRAKHKSRQIIIIDDGDRMSRGAQSAFLKLLEEPNEHIHFIITSHQPQNLLPTIRSRLQLVPIRSITAEQSLQFIASLGITESIKRTQLQFIGEGLPAELTRLASDDAYFQTQATIISDARDFLQADRYQKILIIQRYKTDRDAALQLLESALQILRKSISAKPHQSLALQLEQLLDIKERVANHYNILLHLTQFVL